MTQAQHTPFGYEPDFRRMPADVSKPFCIRCQKNVNTAKAIAVTVNEEKWVAVEGHNNHALVQGNTTPSMVQNLYIGKDCMAAIAKAGGEA